MPLAAWQLYFRLIEQTRIFRRNRNPGAVWIWHLFNRWKGWPFSTILDENILSLPPAFVLLFGYLECFVKHLPSLFLRCPVWQFQHANFKETQKPGKPIIEHYLVRRYGPELICLDFYFNCDHGTIFIQLKLGFLNGFYPFGGQSASMLKPQKASMNSQSQNMPFFKPFPAKITCHNKMPRFFLTLEAPKVLISFPSWRWPGCHAECEELQAVGCRCGRYIHIHKISQVKNRVAC